MDVEVRETIEPLARIVSIRGELDLASGLAARRVLSVAAPDARALVIDLTDCSFIDSSGLASLIETARVRGPDRPPVIVCEPGGAVAQLISLTGVHAIFRVVESLVDARSLSH
jgi:anti-anti-sigma factor